MAGYSTSHTRLEVEEDVFHFMAIPTNRNLYVGNKVSKGLYRGYRVQAQSLYVMQPGGMRYATRIQQPRQSFSCREQS